MRNLKKHVRNVVSLRLRNTTDISLKECFFNEKLLFISKINIYLDALKFRYYDKNNRCFLNQLIYRYTFCTIHTRRNYPFSRNFIRKFKKYLKIISNHENHKKQWGYLGDCISFGIHLYFKLNFFPIFIAIYLFQCFL